MRKRVITLSILSLILIRCMPATDQFSNSSVGQNARAYLTSENYTSLYVEIQAVSGFAPNATTVSNLQTFLQNRLNKPGGIQVVVDPVQIPSPGLASYSVTDILNIEAANRIHYSSGTQQVAYYLFLDGHSSSDTASGSILGEAFAADSIGMFENTIQSLSGQPLTQPSRVVLESTVVEHEFGHLLGLVNVGSGMQTAHQDTAHGAHCTNTSCLMYWNVETSNSTVANLVGGSIPTLDPECIADLQANGGK